MVHHAGKRLANPTPRVREIAQGSVMRLAASADRAMIVAHPGWQRVHALPVVDQGNLYLGAVRYATLRRLELELQGDPKDRLVSARALTEVFSLGAAGIVDLLAGRRED